MTTPAWLVLLSPLPPDAVPHKKPVASAEQIARGTAGPIAGWQSISLHLSDPDLGSRHLLVTIDEHGKLLSAGDHVMLIRETSADGGVTVSDHESLGGRYNDDGSFHGTRWANRLECEPGEDEGKMTSAVKSEPTDSEIALLNGLVADLMSRVG